MSREIDPVAELARACEGRGSARAWARERGQSPNYVWQVLHRRRPPSDAILAALGLRRVERIERIEAARSA